jgi:hypothetical protein
MKGSAEEMSAAMTLRRFLPPLPSTGARRDDSKANREATRTLGRTGCFSRRHRTWTLVLKERAYSKRLTLNRSRICWLV